MKKKLLTLALLVLSATVSLNAKETVKHALNGIWQLYNSGGIANQQDRPLPIFKVLTTDHHFYNIMSMVNSGAVVTATGKYTQMSDSTYYEELDYFALNEDVTGTKNVITYRFSDNGNTLTLTFQVSENALKTTEVWKRVPLMQRIRVPQMNSKKGKAGAKRLSIDTTL